ncbi:MAG: hypothetical protein ACLFQE_06710 [Thermotogota bacterium]
MKGLLLFIAIVFSVVLSFANFQLPVENADRLVSSYGEARLSHDLKNLNFLLGLGISTGEKSGIVIKNMKEGYVERIVSNNAYFGTAIFINHHDNTQARYIGLSRLTGEFTKIYEAVKAEFERSEISITFEEGEFRIPQGEPIGFSGASGFFKIPSVYIELIDLKTSQTLNPLKTLDLSLEDRDYRILFKKIRVNMQEYSFSQGAVYPYSGDKPMVDILIENASSNSEFKLALDQLRVTIDGVEVLAIIMDQIPLELRDKASRVFGEKTNHQTFWYRITTPWTTSPVVKNEIRKFEAFNDKIKVEVEATDIFGTVQQAEFWLKRR